MSDDFPSEGEDQPEDGKRRRKRQEFDPSILMTSVVAIPLQKEIDKARGRTKRFDVVIDLNLDYPGGRRKASEAVESMVRELSSAAGNSRYPVGIDQSKSKLSEQYIFATLTGAMVRQLASMDAAQAKMKGIRAIHRIWPDFEVRGLITQTCATVKADAATNAFSAQGNGITWAVIDSGIDGTHPHFANSIFELDEALLHRDFTCPQDDPETSSKRALTDEYGHGTHVAGILAGEVTADALYRLDGMNERRPAVIVAERSVMGEDGRPRTLTDTKTPHIRGMAPKCKLLSLKVLNEKGKGNVSSIIAALEHVQDLNGNGRRLRVHGVNLSVGYDFDPEWFACGQSPICVEVNRLVRSGVVVVAAAGNTGYGWYNSQMRGVVGAGIDLSINDPGNAEAAITVGSTHRNMPHMYGVSYFSSKGPTGDGRMKPDLVAPGERILSCASRQRYGHDEVDGEGKLVAAYRETSGTSMAAPHVSGVIASFLSVRGEFIGQPEKVKEIFLSTATDLRRKVDFQGRGLVDLMRAIQSV
ncbi:S8 family peptidase [Azospirillum sp. TSO5]|uniref:S8 family peptidase n=1 Tax=Azospirillum sp. TSO5 TaxID=716760 RepID=UPI000D611E03|nr:S8 family peptidase [Azospirillum sp. TSO5]PWC95986.1 peptidase S8/S53 subtilisin kexin sedolisin [Azospirillum sp. TSO5]